MAIQGKLGGSTWPGRMLCSFCITGIDITKVEDDVEVLPGFLFPSAVFRSNFELQSWTSIEVKCALRISSTGLNCSGVEIQSCWKIRQCRSISGSCVLSAEWVTHLRFEWCYIQSVSYCHSPSASRPWSLSILSLAAVWNCCNFYKFGLDLDGDSCFRKMVRMVNYVNELLTGISGTTSYANNDTFSLVGELPEAFKSLSLLQNLWVSLSKFTTFDSTIMEEFP